MVTCDNAPITRPSITLAALSPTALTNVIASLAMLPCIFLTLFEGGDGPRRVGDGLAGLYLWPFVFALCTLLVIATLIVLRPSWYERALLSLPISFAIALSIAWVLVLFSDTDDSRSAMMAAALVAPPGTLIALRMTWLSRNGNAAAAAAWGQGFLCVLAVFSLRWFWVGPIEHMLPGGWLSMISAGLMMVASWTWAGRARHDFYDRASPSLPLQVSLRQIVVAIAVIAVALTYWITFAGSA